MKKVIKLSEKNENILYGSITIFIATAVIVFAIFTLTSCSVFDTVFKAVDDNVSITWKKDEGKKIIDSLHIANKSSYYILNLDEEDFEYDFEKQGYNWWMLKVGNKLRIEVSKKDTIIYIYGK